MIQYRILSALFFFSIPQSLFLAYIIPFKFSGWRHKPEHVLHVLFSSRYMYNYKRFPFSSSWLLYGQFFMCYIPAKKIKGRHFSLKLFVHLFCVAFRLLEVLFVIVALEMWRFYMMVDLFITKCGPGTFILLLRYSPEYNIVLSIVI